MKKLNIVGLMSGTSCDGLDIAYCEFNFNNERWSFKLLAAQEYPYDAIWNNELMNAHKLPSKQLTQLDTDFGRFSGKIVNEFISQHKIDKANIDAIASHGHTVFHKPEEGYTLQIGNGNEIKKITGLKTIYDFRSNDVSLGGQGAPLVPIGDKYLFSSYDYCLNIGGIANLSFDENGIRKAMDVCFVNMILNRLSAKIGIPYDKGGEIARNSIVNKALLKQLLNLDFKGKSLAIEQYEKIIKPILNHSSDSIENLIATVTRYAAIKISQQLTKGKVLVTGGGAYNLYLIDQIKELSLADIVIPIAKTISFKEAILFAFLGALKLENTPNCLASVTGARYDNVGGVIA